MIKVYAQTDHGNGELDEVKSIFDLEDLQIKVGLYAKDVVLTFKEVPSNYDEVGDGVDDYWDDEDEK